MVISLPLIIKTLDISAIALCLTYNLPYLSTNGLCLIDIEFNYKLPTLFKNDGFIKWLWSRAKCLRDLKSITIGKSFKLFLFNISLSIFGKWPNDF